MSTTFQQKKQDLINLISTIDDESVLEEALTVYITKNRKETNEISDSDFEEMYNNGYSSAEFREKITERIKSYPWKK